MFRCWSCFAVLCDCQEGPSWTRHFDPAASKGRRQRFVQKNINTIDVLSFQENLIKVTHGQSTIGWEQSVEALSDPPSTWKVGFAGPIHRAHGKLGLRGLRCFRWCWLTFASRFCGWRGSACKVWKARVSHIGFSTSRMFSHGHCWNRLWPSEVAFASVFFPWESSSDLGERVGRKMDGVSCVDLLMRQESAGKLHHLY